MDEAAARELLEAIYTFVSHRTAVELAGEDGPTYHDPHVDGAVARVAALLGDAVLR